MALLPVAEALDRLLAGVGPLSAETVPLGAAHGRILAKDVTARLTQPPFDAAAMDGYAIRWTDRAGPWRMIGESAAGHGFGGSVGPGEAARIFTGAPLPAGADTIVVQEEIARAGELATLSGEGPPRQGAHIRKAGQDFATGAPIARAGDQLTAARLGLLAASGHGDVAVVRRPHVTLITTGDELVPPGTLPGPNQIVSSNNIMVAALCEATGATTVDPGIIPDRRDALAAALRAADSDVIITIGGASVGDHDLVVPVLRDLGADIDFWKIAMRPGKPMLAGSLHGHRIIGLPGNPVSAYVGALLFVLPLLARLGGRNAALRIEQLPLAAPLGPNGVRRDHLRAQCTAAGVVVFKVQDSALLGQLAAADCLVIREPGAGPAARGALVDCILLDSIGDVS